MPYTGNEIFNMAIAIIDELSDAGGIIEQDVANLKGRAAYLLNLWQNEYLDKSNSVEILRKPVKNLLGDTFGVREHAAGDEVHEAREKARAAVFTVGGGPATVYVEHCVSGGWQPASGYFSLDGGAEQAFSGEIAVSTPITPATYKCRLDETSSAERTRLRFSGDYYYLYADFALFSPAFPDCAHVPDYGEFIKCEMPANFDRASQVLAESPKSGLAHKWEGDTLMARYDYEGIIKITYRSNPAKIASLNQTLDVSDRAAAAAAYYLAMHFAIADQNAELAALCTAKYQEVMQKLASRRPLSPVKIRDVYNVSGL